MEWAFRLASEPRRLWRRYLKHNPRFVALLLRQLWQERRRGQDGERGRFVVLLGADGSGKSSVVKQVAGELAPAFSSVELRHYRPQVRWGVSGAVLDPHARPARSRSASIVKLLYDLFRFRVGYHDVRHALNRGALVLFDRYYHDVFADPLRYRYGGPPVIARAIAQLVPEPDLFIVLDANADTLQQRKAEVPRGESERARASYLRLARTLPRTHVVDSGRPLPDVVADVADLILREPGRA